MEASDQMRRLGEDAQEAFASGNPDTLRQEGGDMMQVLCILNQTLQCEEAFIGVHL